MNIFKSWTEVLIFLSSFLVDIVSDQTFCLGMFRPSLTVKYGSDGRGVCLLCRRTGSCCHGQVLLPEGVWRSPPQC